MEQQRQQGRLGNEAKALFGIAGPLVVNNLSIAGMQFADAVMAGRLGAEALAAVAVGGSVWFLGFALCLGLLMAISPIAARLHGAGQEARIGRYTRQGLYLSVAIAIPIIVFAQQGADPLLRTIGIDATFRDTTVGYVKAITLGAPAMFIFLTLRFTTEGIGVTKPIMYTSLLALVSNVFLNWVFMYGKLGAPAMGAVGCGLASAVTMWLIAVVLGAWMFTAKRYEAMEIFTHFELPDSQALREIVFLGVPIAITITAEAGLFNAVSILMGTLGPEITAAHQIAINFAATMFMIPLALSSAITVRVGNALGRLDTRHARFAGALGIAMCAGFMAVSATFMLLFRDIVVSLYTNDEAVKSIAISLLLLAAIFQVADGVQIGAAGALRGFKDTRIPMLINIVAYWVLAFPLAYVAAVTWRMPPNFIWGGFVIGLSSAAVLLTWRYVRLSKAALPLAEVG